VNCSNLIFENLALPDDFKAIQSVMFSQKACLGSYKFAHSMENILVHLPKLKVEIQYITFILLFVSYIQQ